MKFFKISPHTRINSLYFQTKLLLLFTGMLVGFSASAQTWEQASKILAGDAQNRDSFGRSVSISGDYAIVGALGEDTGGPNTGAAYIFVRSGNTWVQQAKIQASDKQAGDLFGISVSISGDYAIVGAWGETTGGEYAGAAYIFVRSGTTWTEQAKIQADDIKADDNFGYSVSISGDYAIVGANGGPEGTTSRTASGAAYIFVRSGTTWTQQAKIQADDKEAEDYFGNSVAISGDYAIVGAQGEDTGGSHAGAAYIFARSGTSWTQQAKVQASDKQASNFFGFSVSISGDYAIAGAPGARAAYLFARSGTNWAEQAKIQTNGGQANGSFGRSVSISGDDVIVGARQDGTIIQNTGVAYVFSRSGTTWTQQAQIPANNSQSNDYFGFSVGISGDNAIVGAFGQDTGGISDAGASYMFAYKLPQSIAFTLGGNATKTFGDADFNLTATGGASGNAVTFASNNTSVATVSGNTVTIVGAGTATITASQVGNSNYHSAADVTQQLTVNKADQTLSFSLGSDATKTFGDAEFNLTATGGASGNAVTFTSNNTAVATVSGNTVTIVGAGNATITASQASNANYNAANVDQSFTVNKADQALSFNLGGDATKTFGDADFNLTATGGASGNAVTFTSSDVNVATISGNTVTIVGAGNATITASQAGNANYNVANVDQSFTVNKADQTLSFSLGGDATKTFGDADFNLTATGGASGNAVTFASNNTAVATISGNTVTIVGAGTATITASQAGNTNYNAATDVTQLLTVNKAAQTISFDLGSDAIKIEGGADFNLTATGGASGNAVTFASSNTAVATISGNTVTIVGVGTTTITASQSGNSNYNAATDVSQTLTITNKTIQTITFDLGNDATKTFGDADFNLTATGGASGNAVTFASSNTAVATISGNTVTIVGAGTTTITASQAGNATYADALDVTQTLTVNKLAQTISFDLGNDATKTFGDADFNLTATGGASGNTVTFASSDASVATISGNTVTIKGIGTTTITANQAGNDNYDAATEVTQTLTVNKLTQTITFDLGSDATKTFGDADFNLTATGGASGNTVTFTSSDASVATISGNTVTIVGAGTTTITASQAGNATYANALDVTQTLTVNKLAQTISFDLGSDATKTFGDADFNLTATGGASGNSVTFTSSDASVATISGNTVTITGTGTTTITANQAGNDNYDAATEVTQTLTVNSQVTGLPQHLTDGKLTLFPNPIGVTQTLTMKVKGKVNGTRINLTILDNQGKEVLTFTKQLSNGQMDIPVASLATGQYLIKIQIGKEAILRRITKQ